MQRHVGIALLALAFSVAPAMQAQKPDPLIGTWNSMSPNRSSTPDPRRKA